MVASRGWQPGGGLGGSALALSLVFAALAVTRLVEDRTGWSIKKLVRTAAATAGSRSVPASGSSLLRTRSQPTYATRSRSSTDQLRTIVRQVPDTQHPFKINARYRSIQQSSSQSCGGRRCSSHALAGGRFGVVASLVRAGWART